MLTLCAAIDTSQFSGFNTLMHYAATLFATPRFKNAAAVAIRISVIRFVFPTVSKPLLDNFERRF